MQRWSPLFAEIDIINDKSPWLVELRVRYEHGYERLRLERDDIALPTVFSPPFFLFLLGFPSRP